MKVNLNVPIRDFFGKPIIENEKTKKEVNMAEQIGVILFGLGQNLEQSEMVTAYGIARKLQKDPSDVLLSSEEITFLKEKLSKVLTAGCYGQVYDILEQNDK